MTIQEQYVRDRHLLKDGDLILFSGTGFIASVIRSSDKNSDGTKAKHSHIGIIVEAHGALFIVDSNAQGVQADRLSWRVDKYNKDSSFTIMRSTSSKLEIDIQMRNLLRRSDDKWIKYDFKNGIKELCNRRWGTHFKVYLNDEKDICSDYVSRYATNLNMVNDQFKSKTIVFPEDYIRYIDLDKSEIICKQ